MAITFTILGDRVRKRVDMASSGFIATGAAGEMDKLLQESVMELWEVIVGANPDWFRAEDDFTKAGGTEAGSKEALPADFASLISLEKDPGTTYRRNLTEFSRRSMPGQPWLAHGYPGQTPMYRIEGDFIVLEPYEAAAGNYRLRYVPLPTNWDEDVEELDTRLERFAEYVVLATAIKCRDKEESDTSTLERSLARAHERVLIAVTKRDRSGPRVVPDPDGWSE